MTYTTLTCNGVEKSLADWGVSTWSRTVQNQANDEWLCVIPTPMDGSDIFPYGANIIIKINRVASAANPINPTLPTSLTLSPGLSYSGGKQWFWGYCVDNNRVGDPGSESFHYKFVGPYQFFFERLIFQKLQLTWNGAETVADYQSDVVLGLSLTKLTGAGDMVQDSTATNLMSLAQQVKEICMYAQQASALAYGSPQFQCDQLTTEIDGVNWDLLENPSANVLIKDYYGTPLSGKTSASMAGLMLIQPGVAPGAAGSYILRPPLDAVNAITCKDAMQRQLQWIGGIGSPVVWTDHSQTPPQLHIATPDQMNAVSLPLAGITVKGNIKRRSDLIPPCIHFKYKIQGSYFGQPNSMVINDVAAYLVTATGALGTPGASGVALYEGLGSWGQLYDINNPTTLLSSTIQNGLMAAARLPAAVIQTIDLVGNQTSGQKATITTVATNFADPSGGTSGAFWQSILPHLASVSNLRFSDPTHCVPTFTDMATGTAYATQAAFLAAYPGLTNQLPDGQLAPWMTSSGTITARKVKVTGHFGYTENLAGATPVNGPTIGHKEETVTITLTSATTGTYQTSSTAAGEPIPYGLAGYVLALESIPQHEGSIVVQETEISDVCPMGNLLNITGGLTEWATMNAVVQSVRYSDNGQTEITIGPAKHLGPAQFVARLRTNVGPRWYLLISTNPMNAGGSSSANVVSPNIAIQAPSPGAKQTTFLQGFTDEAVYHAAPDTTMPAGWFLDTGAGGNPFTGAIASGSRAFGAGAGLTLARGPVGSTPGESNDWIRVHLADLKNNAGVFNGLQVYLREMQTCENVGGTPTQMFRLILSSQPYLNSIAI